MSRRSLVGTSAFALASVLWCAATANAQTAPASGPAPTPVADEAPDVVVITGQRAAQARGVEMQRKADNFVEALSGDDAGKLPDGNVAEAVKRLPGVSVANDQGEGRYVIIRGANPALANVTINGQTAAAPEPESRQVKLDDVPSALIGSVILTESLTADLDANAIAGQVNINTVTAFDRAGDFYQARLAAGHYDLNGKAPYEGDITVGKRFGANEEFGVVGALNYSTRPIRSENLQGSSNWQTIGGVAVPDDYRPRLYNLTRERTGAVLNFDWRPTDDFRAYVRTTYSKFTDHETRDQYRIEIPTGALSNLTAAGASFTGARFSRNLRLRNEDDNTFNSTVGGQWKLGENTLKAEVGYTKAEKTDPLRSEFVFRTNGAANGISGDLNLTDERYLITPTGTGVTNFNDPTKLNYLTVNFDRRQAVETLWQGRVDYEMPVVFGFGDDTKLAFGAKIIDRDKTNNRDIDNYGTAGAAWNLGGLTAGSTSESTFDGRYPFGPTIDYNLAKAFFDANPTRSGRIASSSLITSLTSDYAVKETITAGYAMATMKFDKWTVIPGVRVEHTDSDYRAKTANTVGGVTTQGADAVGDDSYTDVFPGLNVRYDLSDTLLFRGAITTAIGRPDYAQLPPFSAIDQTALTASLGNPDLEPLKSVNYDLGASWYPWEGAVVSVGVFEKLINSPIYSQVTRRTNFPGAASANDIYTVTQSKNAASAKITGIDFNVQMQFTMLPEGLNGLGVAFTYTSTDGEARGVQRAAPTANTAAVIANTPLFFQSPDVGTAQLFYEKYGFTARLAYSYRSAYLDTVGGSTATDQYTDANGQLDLRLAYDINSHIQLFAEGSNLNDATWRRYQGVERQTVEEERYGWSARVGATVKY